MAKVIDFDSRRQPREHKRQDARTDALRESLAAAREERPGESTQASATRRLLDLYRSKKPDRRKNPGKKS